MNATRRHGPDLKSRLCKAIANHLSRLPTSVTNRLRKLQSLCFSPERNLIIVGACQAALDVAVGQGIFWKVQTAQLISIEVSRYQICSWRIDCFAHCQRHHDAPFGYLKITRGHSAVGTCNIQTILLLDSGSMFIPSCHKSSS